jgi:hypothetical protein
MVIIIMKTYQTTISPSVHQLYEVLGAQLPAKFNSKMQPHTNLNIIENGNSIEIWLPEPYEDYLYKIDVNGPDISVSKSEHYTDDVNSLAMEDVLTDIILEFIGKKNVAVVTPSVN